MIPVEQSLLICKLKTRAEKTANQHQIPRKLQSLNIPILTAGASLVYSPAKAIAVTPTTPMPANAKKLPTYWHLLGFNLRSHIEKRKVVTIVPPRIIMKMDPAMKFRAKRCMHEARASQQAGMAIFNLLKLTSFPSLMACSRLYWYTSGFLCLRM